MNAIQPPNRRAITTLTPAQVNQELPSMLLAALERRWYENFDASQYPIQTPSKVDLAMHARFLQIYEVAQTEHTHQVSSLMNMQNVISSLRDGSHTLVYALHSDGHRVNLLAGVRALDAAKSPYATRDYIDVLYRALRSNFPGVVLSKKLGQDYRPVIRDEYEAAITKPMGGARFLAAISGIPSLKHPDNQTVNTQSIDRLVDALRGERYTLLVVAEPLADNILTQIIQVARELGQQVHREVRQSGSIGTTETTSKTIAESSGEAVNLGAGQILSTIVGISIGQNWSTSTSVTTGTSSSFQISKEDLNKTAQFCEELLDHFVDRIQKGRSLGFWNVGVFLASDDFNTFLRAQGIARSLYSGQGSHFEPIRVLNLTNAPKEARESLENLRVPVIKNLVNPKLAGNQSLEHPLGRLYHSLGTPLTTDELSILMSLPMREVPGLKLKPVADFNLNPPEISGAKIGTLLYRGEDLKVPICISQKSLTRHTFVTGLTGSGKTNTCLALLQDAYQKDKLQFLVIDPAKTEYRFLLNSQSLGKDLIIFTLGDEKYSPFRLNPFEFVRGFPLLAHIDLIKAVFNAAFPMYASMPYLLEDAILEIYKERGWDIASSTNRFLGDIEDPDVDYTPYLPRLGDLYAKIDPIVDRKQYDVRIASDLKAALKARLGSLLNGGKGLMLDTQRSIPIEDLLGRPVIMELRRAGDDDERAMVMALLFVLIYEACQIRPLDNRLQHVTLFEEAHRLLRNIPTSTSAEVANPRGKTVEMFTDMMSEMRAHGEGFIIVDQMPNKLIPDVIKGSNLKIVHRLMAEDDRQSVGNAMGMTAAQINYLPRLRCGETILHSEELEEPCQVMIDEVEDQLANDGVEPGDFDHNDPGARRQHSVKREKLLLQRMQDRSKAFYATHPEILQKYPGCSLCDDPCAYQPQENAPSEALEKFAQDYLTTVALGNSLAVADAGEKLHRELQNYYAVRFPQLQSADTQIVHGKMRCVQVLLASVTARRFVEAYRKTGNWAGMLELEKQLALTFENWPNLHEDLIRLQCILLEKIAISPDYIQPGCVQCPRRCQFGFIFQQGNPPLVAALSNNLRSSQPGQQVSPQKLIGFIQETFGELIDRENQPFAAYCLLAQATQNEKVLQTYRSRLKEQIP